MASEIVKALQHLCDEKDLDFDVVLDALQTALGAAYRKDFGTRQGNYKVAYDPETGDMRVWDVKEVVDDIEEAALEAAQEELTKRREAAKDAGRELTEEEVADLPNYNPKTDMMISEAKEHKKDAKIGDVLELEQEVPKDFGRMAAQTAKQVIIQKLREAERNSVFGDFKEQEGQIVQGTVQRRDRGGAVIIDLGKITGIVPSAEQIQREQYRPGNRMRFYVISVDMGNRGPEIILSRSHENMVRAVFEQEIPEVANNEVEIRGIARDPGNRSKVAVSTDDEGIDPIGSCIGQRGSRITTIIDELGGEKIDVIQYSEDVEEYIAHALSPAKVSAVVLQDGEKEAVAHVAEDQFSLAIGRGGQNVRLAADLTGWKINVVQEGDADKSVSSDAEVDEVEAALQTEDEGNSDIGAGSPELEKDTSKKQTEEVVESNSESPMDESEDTDVVVDEEKKDA